MTREEALKTLKDRIEQYTGGVHPGEREILIEAFAALRGSQPDPKTGLAPCGCGGVPVVVNEPGSWGYYPERWHIRCCEDPLERRRCGMRTSSVETEEEAKRIWNTAMSGGWKNDSNSRHVIRRIQA